MLVGCGRAEFQAMGSAGQAGEVLSERSEVSASDAVAADEASLPPAFQKGQNATVKGNFVVWTVPTSPAPNEPYKVMIRLSLLNASAYDREELSGSVVGSDGFRGDIQEGIGGVRMEEWQPTVEVFGNYMLKTVPMPGATETTRDVVTVRSRTLQEEQTLALDFCQPTKIGCRTPTQTSR
jgi:hypothetical protein